MGQGTWTTYDAIEHDEGFAEMADFLQQKLEVKPRPFRLSGVDAGELWAITLRCAASINTPQKVGGGKASSEVASRSGQVAPTHRTSDNVWLEVKHRAQEWMDAGTPVYTLARNVRNLITNVTSSKIERRSDEPRGGGQSAVSRRKIVELWDALIRDGHTRNVPSPLYFAHALLQAAIPGIGYEEEPSLSLVLTDAEEANRVFEPDAQDVPGLMPAPPASRAGGRGGGGGEGETHAALKAKVKNDPFAALGEALTYMSEDLTDRLGDEVPFVTGDRVDLLMKDEEGKYIVIEVEPVIGPGDHIGFHQAAKYWVLIAVAKGIDLDRVRRMVVATSIDQRLRDHYKDRYGIEWAEVSLP